MAIDPNRLRGIWQREIITYQDGKTDASLRIYWIQSQSLYADIRVPYDFSPFRKDASLDSLTPAEAGQLARLGGFAGRVTLNDSTCAWERVLDWQPYAGVPDVAELDVKDDHLVENGGACQGHQIWRRLSPLFASSLGLELRDEAEGRHGFLVSLAGQFIYARGRTTTLPPASGLAGLLTGHEGDVGARRALFDAEISYGGVNQDSSWTIEYSTHPWRVGDSLLASPGSVFDKILVVRERDYSGSFLDRVWAVTNREEAGTG